MSEQMFNQTGRTLRPRADRSVSREPVTRPSRRTKQKKQGGANPTVDNPALPNVDTQKSFAYGSSSTPALPRQVEADPSMGERQMAAALDMGMRLARGREFESIKQAARASPDGTRSTGRQSVSVSPSRRSRQATPEDQLLESLREASEEAESSYERASTAVGESSVSWITERAVLRGQGHAAPVPANRSQPRRFPFVPSRGPTPQREVSGDMLSLADDTVAADVPRMDSIPSSAATMVGTTSATRNRRVTGVSPKHVKKVSAAKNHQRPSPFNMRLLLTLVVALIATLGVCTLGGKLMSAAGEIHVPFSGFGPWKSSSCGADTGSAAYEAINKLTSEVDRRFSDIAIDVAALKEEWDRRLPLIKQAINPEPHSLPPRRINFLSPGLGTIIEPYLTSPSITEQDTFLQSVRRRLAGARPAQPPITALTSWDDVGDCWCAAKVSDGSRLATLLGRPIVPEEVVVEHISKDETLDPGAAPRHMELWVQYKPQPPKDYDPSSPDHDSPHDPIPSSPSSHSPLPPSAAQTPTPLDPDNDDYYASLSLRAFARLRETVLSTLRMVYPDEPEDAYSNDPYFGPYFYRVGKWEYDINASNNVQRFLLDAVIDMPGARVEKVVFRVKSTWGGENACLYRLRLHGHL